MRAVTGCVTSSAEYVRVGVQPGQVHVLYFTSVFAGEQANERHRRADLLAAIRDLKASGAGGPELDSMISGCQKVLQTAADERELQKSLQFLTSERTQVLY